MNNVFSSNEDLLLKAVSELEPILDRVAFIGGSTIILHLDQQVKDIRVTNDVDMIIDATMREYQKTEKVLRDLGFQPVQELVCRYQKDNLMIDLMPVDPKILGFSSRWYAEAIQNTEKKKIGKYTIEVIGFPYLMRNNFS